MDYQAQLGSFHTETALTATSAMDRLDDFEPDVIVIDEVLPTTSGPELSQWIRKDQAAPHYYAILLLTAQKGAEWRELQDISGADQICGQELARSHLAASVELLLRFQKLQNKTTALLQKLQMSKETIRDLEDQDSITRLYNLPYINSRLEKELRHAERFGTSLSVMIMAIDGFKEMSYTHGPNFCIRLLQQLGNDLIHLTRSDDVLGRSWGGEYLMILPETETEGAMILQSRILHHMNHQTYGLDPHRITVRVSFGLCTRSKATEQQYTIQDLLLAAEDDLHLQQQKNLSRKITGDGVA
jgi:diguanylate cyclase (GGDEF)-like protein